MKKQIAIDIGGTKTNVCLVEFDNNNFKILEKKSFLTEQKPEYEIQKIEEAIKLFESDYSKIALSLPGKWSRKGTLEESFFLHEWLNYPFVKVLGEKTAKEVTFKSDVISGGLGEYHYGVGKDSGKENLLYINLGTGIGASFIQNGVPFESKGNLTLRLQKLVVAYGDELYSGTDLIAGGTLSQAASRDPKVLFDQCKNADIEAMEMVSKAQAQLASWIINLHYLLAPDVIVLNGGLTKDWEVLAEGAIDLAKEELGSSFSVLSSTLGEDAPIYGAIL